jgi:hypothetical protein
MRVKIGNALTGPRVVRRSFTLSPGDIHVVTVGPASGPPGARLPVVATLLRHSRTFEVYRRVKGWLVVPRT